MNSFFANAYMHFIVTKGRSKRNKTEITGYVILF